MTDSKRNAEPDRSATYQIVVQGRLDKNWSDWFNGMIITVEDESAPSPITTLTGAVADQAALRGILTKIWDLGLTLISAVRLDSGIDQAGGPNRERRK